MLLSLMMQHLLHVKTDRSRPAYIAELEELFGGRLVQPIAVAARTVAGQEQLIVRMVALSGLRKQSIAQIAGQTVWRHLDKTPTPPDLLIIEVADEGAAPTETLQLPRPVGLSGVRAGTQAGSPDPKPAGNPPVPGR